MVQEPRYYHLCYVKLSILVSHFEAGLVSLVVFRDVFLVGGAVFLRANSLGWKVWTMWFSSFSFCLRNCIVIKIKSWCFVFLSVEKLVWLF